MRIVIVEDERLTAEDLARTLLRIDPSYEIVQMISSVEEGLSFFSRNDNVDLIFSDIQLGDGLSFQIFEKLSINAPVIYCTAFDEYALKAFKTLGIEYILKPFTKDTVKKALDKYLMVKGKSFSKESSTTEVMSLLKEQLSATPKKLLIKRGEKIFPLDVYDVAVFYIDQEIVYAFTFSGKKYALDQKLNALENTFSKDFFRTSRQHLVNRKAIRDASQYFNRKLKVSLNTDFKEDIIVGKLKVTPFLNWWTES